MRSCSSLAGAAWEKIEASISVRLWDWYHQPTARASAAKNGQSRHAQANSEAPFSARSRAARRVSKPYSRREVSGVSARAAEKSASSFSSRLSFMAGLQDSFQILAGAESAHLDVAFAPAGQLS